MAKFSGDTRLKLVAEGSAAAAARALNTLTFRGGHRREVYHALPAGTRAEHALCPTLLGRSPAGSSARADGTVEELGKDVRGFPLGIVPDALYDQIEILLRPGDVAVIYSDGVTDARNTEEELYDTQATRRLLNCIRSTIRRARGGRPGDPSGNPRILKQPCTV